MIKKILTKLFGLETPDECLSRLERVQVARKDTIDRLHRTLKRLKAIHSTTAAGPYKQSVAEHIELVVAKLDTVQQQYAVQKFYLNMIRTTIEADRGILA